MQEPQVDVVVVPTSIRVEWFQREPGGGTLFLRLPQVDEQYESSGAPGSVADPVS